MGGNRAALGGGGGSKSPLIIGGTTCLAVFCFFGNCGSCTKSSLLPPTRCRFLFADVWEISGSSSRIFRSDCGDELPSARPAGGRLVVSSEIIAGRLSLGISSSNKTFCCGADEGLELRALALGSSGDGLPEERSTVGSCNGGRSSPRSLPSKSGWLLLGKAISRGSIVVYLYIATKQTLRIGKMTTRSVVFLRSRYSYVHGAALLFAGYKSGSSDQHVIVLILLSVALKFTWQIRIVSPVINLT